MNSYSKTKNNRNPILNIKTNTCSYNVQTIGDVHLGRTFRTGVSSSKFGIRENLVLKDFERLLNPSIELDIDFIVIMGDLFDKFIVKPSVVDSAVTLIEQAIILNPSIVYFVIPGNHDLSKDKTKVSSYYLFQKIFETDNESENSNLNLHILYTDPMFYKVDSELLFYFDSYDPFHKEEKEFNFIEDRFKELVKEGTTLVSFGHWDNPKNDFADYLPSNPILKYSSMIVSGHIHTPEKFIKDKIEYIYTGSIQPYSHAEDPDNTFYLTILYTELEKCLADLEDPLESFSNLNIRVNCYPGYLISRPFECLSLIYNNVIEIPKEITDDLEVIEVDSNKITDFTSLYLYKLKYEYDIQEDLLLKINTFLKDSSEDVSFTLDQE